MIERILEQESAVRQVLSSDRKSVHLIPSWQDMQVLEAIKSALGPLHSFTDLLSGEKHVTVSAVMPLLHHLYSEILIQCETDTQLTKDIKARVKAYMKQKYSDEEMATFLNTASYLDPRFKAQYMDEATRDNIKVKLIEEGKQLSRNEPPSSDSLPSTSVDSQSHSMSAPPDLDVPPKKRKLSDLFKTKPLPPSFISAEVRVKKEMATYLEYSVLDADSSPLEWWKLHSEACPILSILARKYLLSLIHI